MLDFNSDFHQKARRLKSPTSKNFDAEIWVNTFDGSLGVSDDDRALLFAAMWFGLQSAALRLVPKDPVFEALSAAESVTLAIAMANHEFLTVSRLAQTGMTKARNEGSLSFDHIARRPLDATANAEGVTADDVIETALDSAGSWIFDAATKSGGRSGKSDDVAPTAVRAMQYYSIQYTLNNLWNRCFWEGWRIGGDAKRRHLTLADQEFETNVVASRIREAENFMNYPFLDIFSWAQMAPSARRKLALPRTVTDVRYESRRRIRVARPECLSRQPPSFIVDRAGLEGSYLQFALDRTFTSSSLLSCRVILCAWHVILDLALALMKSSNDSDTLSLAQAERLALTVSRREIVQTLSKALAVGTDVANAIVEFLSFKPETVGKKGNRGLWAAPIVKIPHEDKFVLALPALAASNPIRKAEAWLERGGIDDTLSKDARGNVYEASYRRNICAAIAGNTLFQTARCAELAIPKDKSFSEQIDLLFRLGPLLVVGEVKCWLFPAEPLERFNYMRKLREACDQARRKATLLATRPDVSARALGVSEETCKKLQVVPLVVVNQGFGFSLVVNGCRITDARYLLNYLSVGSIVTSAGMNFATGEMIKSVTLQYKSEGEAAENFERALAHPFVLRRFAERLSWENVPFPTANGGHILVPNPRLGDLTGSGRDHAVRMTQLLEGF